MYKPLHITLRNRYPFNDNVYLKQTKLFFVVINMNKR